MARPTKKGMDYFPHDTIPNKKLERFYRLFKAKGKSFWFTMLEEIYREEGYFIDVSDAATRLILADACFCTPKEWDAMVVRAIKESLFDKDRYEQEMILTSAAIFQRFESVAKKRKQNADYYENRVSVAEPLVSVVEPLVSATETGSELGYSDPVSVAETGSDLGYSDEFPFTREIKEKKIKEESPISPFLKPGRNGDAPPATWAPAPDLVLEVYQAYPRLRRKGATLFPVRICDGDKDKIAEFIAQHPDYPLLEAVKLLKDTADMPPDLSTFLAAPWDLDGLRQAAASRVPSQAQKDAQGSVRVLEAYVRRQEEAGPLDLDPEEIDRLNREAEKTSGIKFSPIFFLREETRS